jgi:tetratricopeptide (TPR) repeat protein
VETGLYDEWLVQTERLESKAFPEMSFHDRMAYACWRSDAYFRTERYHESIQVGEAFLDFMDSHPSSHPHRRWYLLDIYAARLLSSYQALGQQEKIEETFQFIESTLEQYEDEWRRKISELKRMDESELRKLDAVYEGIGVEIGNVYPLNGSKEQIQRWLDEMYKSGIDTAYHNIGCGFAWIGEGEKAIQLFLKKRTQADGDHHVWLAAFLLQFRKDREAALSHLKQATEDRGYVASGDLKRAFEHFNQFEPVRNDPEFLAIVNTSVIAE